MRDASPLPFTAQAQLHEKRIAIIDQQGAFTYLDLLSASSRVAVALLAGSRDLREARVGLTDARSPTRTRLNRQQIVGFWGAWAGWTLDGMDSVIYALVLTPALTEVLPGSGIEASPANVGWAGSILFALFLVGWGLSLV